MRADVTGMAGSRYGPACSRLLAQFKTMMKLVGDSVTSVEAFMSEYRVRNALAGEGRAGADSFRSRWTARRQLTGYR